MSGRRFLLPLLLWCVVAYVCAQQPFRVMFYNVENLFDCRHDTLKQDTEFLPEGARQWTTFRYWRKLNALSKVVAAVGEERLPDLIGLCEVENDSVVRDLTRRSVMRTLGYRYVMTDSPDVRGVDVALLYQPGSFRLLEWRELRVPSAEQGFRPTRNILYAKGLLLCGDTLHAVVCHLPSRLGKARVSKRNRALAARTLRGLVDSLYAHAPRPNVVVMGDFNAGLKDEVFRKELSAVPLSAHGALPLLYAPPLQGMEPGVRGSYRYRGIWETIDHIFVSPSLVEGDGALRLREGAGRIVAFPFLCEPEAKYGGQRPFRTYQGPLYKGGYSDHFPVMVDLQQVIPF